MTLIGMVKEIISGILFDDDHRVFFGRHRSDCVYVALEGGVLARQFD